MLGALRLLLMLGALRGGVVLAQVRAAGPDPDAWPADHGAWSGHCSLLTAQSTLLFWNVWNGIVARYRVRFVGGTKFNCIGAVFLVVVNVIAFTVEPMGLLSGAFWRRLPGKTSPVASTA